MKKRLWLTCLGLGLVAFAAAFAACGDDDDNGGGGGGTATAQGGDEKQRIADLATRLASTNGAEGTQEEIDFFLDHVLDSFVQEFGMESIEACSENTAACIGEPLPGVTVSADDVTIDGDSAKVVVGSDIGLIGIDLTIDGGEWKASGLFVPDDEIPSGTTVVEFEMAEFAFPSDLDNDAVKSGDFALRAKNIGQQSHEIVLVPLPAGRSIDDLLQDDTYQPEPIFVKFSYGPGEESDIALPEPLDAGRYAFVCFLPDTSDAEFTPHAFKGMTREFTVE